MPEEVGSTYGRALTIALGVVCLGTTIAVGVFAGWTDAALTAPWTALFALLCWAAFWRPRVVVSDAGVQLVNVTRTIFIPGRRSTSIDTKWALTLVTAHGRFTAVERPAPGARGAVAVDGARGADERPAYDFVRRRPAAVEAAALVRERWDRLRAAGHLDDPRLERDRPQVRWHVGTGLAVAALLAVGIATLGSDSQRIRRLDVQLGTLEVLALGDPLLARVERVAQTVADELQAQDDGDDEEPRPEEQPGPGRVRAVVVADERAERDLGRAARRSRGSRAPTRSRMPAPISSVVLTMIVPTVFGRMCLKMIRRSGALATRAASTNSRSRRARNSARTRRASPVHVNRPSAKATGHMPDRPRA